MSGLLIANLETYADLMPEERAEVESVVGASKRYGAGADLLLEGDVTSECHVLLQGQAFRHRTLPDGRRQIMLFHAPGDIVDLQGLLLGLDYSVAALTDCQIAPIPHAKLEALLGARPRVARAIWRYSLVEAAIYREWMLGIGRRTALARVAHLLCEVFTRLEAVGLARDGRCTFPATQIHIADALGLSTVHTNRVLQSLRGAGLIEYRGGELIIRDWKGLCAAGEFDAAYLHIPDRAA